MTNTLVDLATQLRKALAKIDFALPLSQTAETKQWVDASLLQLNDYVIPRLHSIEAPLLAVVGGSTGAGKSTLINSLVAQVVSTPGVIRPTTKAPVLVHHPDDAQWFASARILPSLARSLHETNDTRSLQIVSSKAAYRRLALLDAPDIDSVDANNRALATQLLAAADLWVFVTSAARYADAVPWDYLDQAVGNGAAVAVVVDRVPPAAMTAVPAHLAEMMAERGLGDSPLFVIPETITDEQGILPPSAVKPIKDWLDFLASSRINRAQIVLHTLDGALVALEAGLEQVADQLAAQSQALYRLKTDAESIYEQAKLSARTFSADGSLLRGEVMARWQDFVGTGEIMRTVESGITRARDRITRFLTGRTSQAMDLKVAVKSGLEAMIIESGQAAVSRVEDAWSADPAGRYLLEMAGANVGQVSADFFDQVDQAILGWQDDVLEIVTKEGASRRTKARFAALGVNAAGVCLMLVAFGHTAGITGIEIGIAGGTAVVAQKVLELIFGDEAIRRLTHTVEETLGKRIDQVLESQLQAMLSTTIGRIPPVLITGNDLMGLGAQIGEARRVQMTQLEDIVLQNSDNNNTLSEGEPVLVEPRSADV